MSLGRKSKKAYEGHHLKQRSLPVRIMVGLMRDFFQYRVSRSAAQLSYYMLFSVFPVILIAIGCIGFLNLEVDSLLHVLDRFSSFIDLSVLTNYISYIVDYESPTLMITGASTAILASSAAFRGLLSITSEVIGREKFTGLVQFLISLLMSFLLLLTIFMFLLATVTGRWFVRLCVDVFHLSGIALAWQWLRFPIVFALGTGALTLVYRVCISKKALPNAKSWPGAIAAAIALVVATAVFSAFISMSTKYSMIYGSLASIVVMMLWFFICGAILAMGSVFNCVLAKETLPSGTEPTITFKVPDP